jgi:GTPase SAR1 family protein
MSFSWVAPAILAGIKERKDIGSFLAGLWAKLFSRKARLAVTGMEGAGKTVLLDALTGKAFQRNYTKPTRSQKMETGSVAADTRKIILAVVPGQQAHPRHVALDDIFRGKRPVDGAIHVVSSGFASVRTTDAVRVLVTDHGITTVRKFRQYQKRREVEDLQETCRAIRDAHRRHHAPKWLVVAVDKVDLYHNELAEIERQYSPSAQTDFVRELNALAEQVGTDFFRWTALPVIGCIENFEWNGHTHHAQLQEEWRERYLKQFLTELVSYCG